MRFAAYAGTSMALATGVIFRALHSRANFYSACVYLSQSNACLMILSNLLLLVVGSLLLGLQRLLYGPLRPIEIEQLYEKAWFAVTETCLAMTIFRDEVGAWFVVMFVSLLVGKVWGWIGEGRVEILEQQPPANPRLFHARLFTSLAASLVFDAYLLKYSISTVQKQARPNMMVMFAFEFAVLIVNSLSTSLRYAISLREAAIVQEQTSIRLQERRQDILQQREEAARSAIEAGEEPPEELPVEEMVDETDIDAPGWEEKSRWVFYLDLATDFVKLFLYLTFFCVLCMFYGMPIHIIRDVALTIRSFYKRITDFLKYRHATRDMNERYPDATEDEIRSQDVCIICREAMVAWPGNRQEESSGAGVANPVDERLRPKKLPCGHTLHFACLRSWLERQQNCPTCRQPVLASNPGSPNALRAPNQANGDHARGPPGGERGNNNAQRPAEHNRVRFFNLGPIRLGFGAGHDLRGLEQQFENRPALHPNARNNNENVHQFGLSLGLGRPQRQALAAASGQLSLPNIQAQLQTFEQQLLQDINSLQLQNEQLQVVRQLQGELARLRIATANHNTSRAINGAGLIQTPPQPHNLFGNVPQPQIFTSASGANAGQHRIGSGDPNLPPGVTIPEGWTLLPLHPISESHGYSAMAQSSGSNDLNRTTRSTVPMTYQPTNRSAVTTPHQAQDLPSRAARSTEASSENSTQSLDLDPPHLHTTPRSREGNEHPPEPTGTTNEDLPQWSFRPTPSNSSQPAQGTQIHDPGADSKPPGNSIEDESTDNKVKGQPTTVEDAEDSDAA